MQQTVEAQSVDCEMLAAKIAQGDRAAEALLVTKYQRCLLEMLRYRTRDYTLADDLLQDTLKVIIERLRKDSIKDPAKLTQFIHATARNIVIGHYRKEARRGTQVNTDIVNNALDQRSGQLQNIIKQQQSSNIRSLIIKLSKPRDREILMRFYVWEQEKLQVCHAMELTVGAFDRVVSRARKRFKDILEQ